MPAGCSSCGGRNLGLTATRAASTVTAYKVVDGDGRCALEVDGLCRVFADTASAVTAATGELGSSGWSVVPVIV